MEIITRYDIINFYYKVDIATSPRIQAVYELSGYVATKYDLYSIQLNKYCQRCVSL